MTSCFPPPVSRIYCRIFVYWCNFWQPMCAMPPRLLMMITDGKVGVVQRRWGRHIGLGAMQPATAAPNAPSPFSAQESTFSPGLTRGYGGRGGGGRPRGLRAGGGARRQEAEDALRGDHPVRPRPRVPASEHPFLCLAHGFTVDESMRGLGIDPTIPTSVLSPAGSGGSRFGRWSAGDSQWMR